MSLNVRGGGHSNIHGTFSKFNLKYCFKSSDVNHLFNCHAPAITTHQGASIFFKPEANWRRAEGKWLHTIFRSRGPDSSFHHGWMLENQRCEYEMVNQV